jgi:hypothetical protein
MSTGTAKSATRATSTAAGVSAPAERERFIERQLRRTRRQVRGVELTSRFMLLTAAAVVFFLVAAVFDHWLIPGGLSVYGRLAFLVVFFLGAGWFAIRELAPLFVYRINPLFAAHTIERAKPTLKNSLLNFLMLRSHRTAVPEVVLSAVEEQAAVNLQKTPIDHVVDHTRLVHLGYLLLAAVAAFCTYYLVSPKSPLQTVGRVVLPWADMQPPSRVQIDDIEPGTTTVFRGQRAAISATVRGLQEGEAVTLYFSTADRQHVDQPVRMYVAKDSNNRHSVTLPPNDAAALSMADAGLQQDLEYRIEAGDAVSRTHRLSVIQAPNIVVEKLDYLFPPYTGLETETVEKSGDIKAVEGTQVTIHARANQPIASAYVDLGGGTQRKQPMKVNGQRAITTITLALNEERTAPIHSYYHVRFQTDRGHENPEPIRNRIEVTPDPSPELQLLRPEKVETAVPLNAPVEFELDASDPLYGLSDVRIVASVGSEPAFRRNRAVTKDDKSAARLVYKHLEHLDRITLDDGKKLKPGDVIEYWAEAVDNKSPKPNVTKTDVRKLLIVEPQQQQQQQQNQNQQQQENNQGKGQPNENQQNGNGDPQNKQPNDQQNREQPQERGNNDAGNNQGEPQPDQDQQQPGQNNQKSGNNNQKRGANEPDSKGAKGDQRNEDKSTGQQNQERPQDQTGENEQQNQPNNAGNQQKQRNDQKSAGNANQKDQAGGKESATKDQQNGGKGQKSERQPGDPSADGAGGEQSDPQNNGAQNSAQKGADGQNGASQQDQKPVPKSDEGTAFDRILDHAREQGKTPEQSKENQANQRPAANDQGEQNNDNAAAKRDPNQPPAGKNGNAQDRQSNQQNDERSAQSQDDAANETQRNANAQERKDEGAKTGEAQNDQSTQQKRGNEKGGSTPAPQERSRPTTKQSPADSGDAKSDQQEKSPSQSKQNSPKKGQHGGDQNARGKDGGGQNDNRAGSGAKGASDPADQGADSAKEPGAGDTGKKAGDDKTANGKTGKSGDEQGDGSKTRPTDAGADAKSQKDNDAARNAADSNDGNGDATGQKHDARNAEEQNQPGGNERQQQPSDQANSKDSQKGEPGQGDGKGEPSDQPGDSKSPNGKAASGKQNPDARGKSNPLGGGGTPEGDPAEPPDFNRELPSGDKANLDYAKRATDLALDHLRNQLKNGKPDQELLDRLGWSKDDLQKLLTRWETMQREAQQTGPKGAKAKANFEEAVQSLGIRPPSAARRASTKADDSAQGLRDAARSAPPPEYIEGFEAFRKRTSRGD